MNFVTFATLVPYRGGAIKFLRFSACVSPGMRGSLTSSHQYRQYSKMNLKKMKSNCFFEKSSNLLYFLNLWSTNVCEEKLDLFLYFDAHAGMQVIFINLYLILLKVHFCIHSTKLRFVLISAQKSWKYDTFSTTNGILMIVFNYKELFWKISLLVSLSPRSIPQHLVLWKERVSQEAISFLK